MKCEKCGAESAGRLCLKCSAEQNELPIPASFFSPEESSGSHTFTLSDDSAGQGGFTITAASLKIEAVSPETPETLPELDLPKQPAPAPKQPEAPAPRPQSVPRRTEAPASAPGNAASEPIQTPQGFYLVPYDESFWATLSRIRHRWLLPVLVGIIFIAGMVFGVMMARSSGKKQPEPAVETQLPAVTTAPHGQSPMDSARLQLYFSQEILPQYGYFPVDQEVDSQPEGIISAACCGKRMTVLRKEGNSIMIDQFELEEKEIRQLDSVEFPNLDVNLVNAHQDVTLIGNASGIYFGNVIISDSGVGTSEADPPVSLCICRAVTNSSYFFSDLTGIRDEVEDPATWEVQYPALIEKIAAELAQDESGQYRTVQVDGDETPELEIQITHSDGTVSAQLYTFAFGEPVCLTKEQNAAAYECIVQQNCYREKIETDAGTVYKWYHIQDFTSFCDHTEQLIFEDGQWVYYLDGEKLPADMLYHKEDPDASKLEKAPEYTPITKN